MSELAHYGKKGMRWGVTTKTKSSSGPSIGEKTKASASRLKSRLDAMPPERKRRAVIAIVGTGAAVTAGILAGPVGGMTVSGITRAVDQSFGVRTTTIDRGVPPTGPSGYGSPIPDRLPTLPN